MCGFIAVIRYFRALLGLELVVLDECSTDMPGMYYHGKDDIARIITARKVGR